MISEGGTVMDELEIIVHHRVPGLTIFINSVDYRCPHMHAEWELLWVLEGPLSVTCGAEHSVLESEEMILFAPDEPHEFHMIDKETRFLCIQIAPSVMPLTSQLQLLNRLPCRCLTEQQQNALKWEILHMTRSYLRGENYYEMECIG